MTPLVGVDFEPDYTQFRDVMRNVKPTRLPLYEHNVSPSVMERILDREFAEQERGDASDQGTFFDTFCGFFKSLTYDIVPYECNITSVLPGEGALSGGQGPIQTRADFDAYPWDDIPRLYWDRAGPLMEALAVSLPPGMKAVGGVGNGAFEISEDLVGLEYLALMQVDDPELYADLYSRIGDTLDAIWKTFLERYAASFVAARFGDDLGFRSSLLTNPTTVRDHVFPQYRRVIDQVHQAGLPFLWHSCGCIFEVMEDAIDLGIDAKHSNEDAIAPFDRWIADYGDRIGLVGGFDMDLLCSQSEDEVYKAVRERAAQFRDTARGYAVGSGNSIPDYVPEENYLAMIRAVQDIRRAISGK